VLDEHFFRRRAAQRTPARIQFLLESIAALTSALERAGSRLIVVGGRSVDVVPQLAQRWKVDRVVAQSWVAPVGRARDRKVASRLHVPLQLFDTETLCPPAFLRTGAGEPYSVFSAFARAFRREVRVGTPLAAPRRLPPVPREVRTRSLALPTPASLGIARNAAVAAGGEAAANYRMKSWLAGRAQDYDELRNRLDLAGTSRLSADLKFGTLSVRSLWHAAERRLQEHSPDALRVFQDELLWREFAHSTLFDRPTLLEQPFRPAWRGFPWRDDETAWQAWVEGTTGYPVVDAAARQLGATGFVHNRARMIAASFLAKHLLIDFRRGECHYFEKLVDGDWANNDAGWQWSAGCGCDAQPWFRIFNPVTQGQKFDPQGEYVRRWVPELAQLPARYIHAPHTAPAEVLAAAGVSIGRNYPRPIVDHTDARRRFIATARKHLRS